MITLNQKIKLPWSARLYGITWLFIILFIITLFIGGLVSDMPDTFNSLGRFMILVAIWLLLDYACINFIVSEKTLTINSGILIKKSKSIPFSSIQNIIIKKGIIAMIFGVSRINIWTASPGQIRINNGNSENRPSGSLLIMNEDAEWLKNFILKNKI